MNTIGDDMRYSGDSEDKSGSQSSHVTGKKSPPTLAGGMNYAESPKDRKGSQSSGNGTQTHEDVSMRDKLSVTDDSRKKNGSKKSQGR
ncbi:hypothetical protein glysoja_026391 [Glycine soja]|uniref:Uncharacterized protein n=1 Tax=Glycine soja TaxID=3848 RepID=A0A0B2STZ0_GLYSO|nr:hypothetical protein glysoja_026391 [Glycine soja]